MIVIFSGFGEFDYAKKAIQYGVSEYMLKPVTAMELKRNVIGKMKEKVDQQRKEREAGTSDTDFREYQKNAIVIRSRALQGFVDNIDTGRKVWKSLQHWESILRQHAIVWLFFIIWICIRTAVSFCCGETPGECTDVFCPF